AHWTYTADNSQAAIQHLGAGSHLTDSFTAVSQDEIGRASCRERVYGTEDVAVFGGNISGSVTEDVSVSGGNLHAAGDLTIADVDTVESHYPAHASIA